MNLRTFLSALAVAGLMFALPAKAEGNRNYKVTITNITKSMRFTPILLATHNRRGSAFQLGAAPSEGLAAMAEGGDVSGLMTELRQSGSTFDTANSADVLPAPPLLAAGESVTLRISSNGFRNRLTMAAMLLPTNDTFVALNAIRLPNNGQITLFARAYDAGSEPNDEVCANIPGPTCGGEGVSAGAGGEGFVHVASGIQGGVDLDPAVYDFNNPVAQVVITRIP